MKVILMTLCGCTRMIDVPDNSYEYLIPLFDSRIAFMGRYSDIDMVPIKKRRFVRSHLMQDGFVVFLEEE